LLNLIDLTSLLTQYADIYVKFYYNIYKLTKNSLDNLKKYYPFQFPNPSVNGISKGFYSNGGCSKGGCSTTGFVLIPQIWNKSFTL